MTRFRTRTIEVEAVKFAGSVGAFPLSFLREGEAVRPNYSCSDEASLEVFRGRTTLAIARRSDWLIRHPDGTLDCCNSEIFETYYEQVGGGQG